MMLFTNGFLLCRVELDELPNLLLDTSSGRMTQQSLSESFIDGLIHGLDSVYDGAISPDELMKMIQELQNEKRNTFENL